MRSHYYWSFVVCVFILFVGKFVVAQQEFEAGGVWYNPITDTSVAVTHPPTAHYTTQNLTIPQTISHNGTNYTVTAIADRAFFNCTSLQRIDLPQTISYIGNFAFSGGENLSVYVRADIPPECGVDAFTDAPALYYIPCRSYWLYHANSSWAWIETLFRGLEGDRTVRHDTTVCVGPNTFELHHPYADTITYNINRNIIRPSSFAETSRIFPIEGCIITDSLVVDIFPEGSYNEQTVYLCPQNNNQYEFSQPIHGFDTIIRHSGTYTFRFPQGNCYDIYVIKVIDVNNDRGTEVVNKCKGEIYRYVDNGIPRTARSDTAYIKSVPRIGGCDSLVNVSVRFFDTIYNVVNGSICQGGSYTWSRSGYDNSGNYRTYRSIHDSTGVYVDALKTNMGCSNKQVLNLVVNPVYNDTIYDTVCYGVAYNAYGFNIPLNRIENRLYTISRINSKYSQFGCDSTTHLRLTIKPTKQTNLGDIDLCRGSSYDFHGRHLTTGGTYRDTLQTYLGCDSIVRVNIVMRENEYHPTNGHICDGNSYIWSISGYKRNASGNLVQTTIRDTLTQSGTYADTTLLTQYGCANKHNLTLVVNPIYNDTIYDTICYGSSYSGHGFNFTVPRRDTIYTITKVNNKFSVYGCDSTTHLRLTVKPTKQTNLGDVDLCRGSSYDFHGQHLTTGGTYRDTLQTYLGCDSVVRVNIVMRENEYHPTNGRICDGNSYIWSISGYKRNALGNLVQTTIRDTLTQSGTYADTTLLTQYGCANKHNLTLVVNPVYNDTIYDTICYGSSYSGHGFNIPLVQIENRDYTIDRVNSLRSRFGCDSITTLKLQVWQKYNTHIYDTITENGHYDFFGRTLTTAGIYSNTLESVHGCDSTIMLHLFVHMNVRTDFNADICHGQTYTENGFNADSTGTYYQRLQTIHGADSIVVLNLVVHPTYDDTLRAAICQGESYTLYGFNETTAGTYTHADTSRYGCDSLFTLVLTVNPVYDTTITAEICDGSIYNDYGFEESSAGLYTHSGQSIHGCDSLFRLNLIVNPVYDTLIVDSICIGATYDRNGFNEQTTGVYTQHLYSEHGCDSIVRLNLKVISFLDTIYADICEGQVYDLYGFNESRTGVYVDSLQSVWGCDSVVVLNLTVHENYSDTIYAETCDNIPYTLHGFNADSSGVYVRNLQSVYGCDSVVTLILTVWPTYTIPLNKEICEGETYIDHGFWLTYPGTFIISSHTSCHGCDSLFVLNLAVNPTYDELMVANICQGDTFRLQGYDNLVAWESGRYRDVIESSSGCDSAKTVILTVNPTYMDTIYGNICEGERYTEHGFNESSEGIYTNVLTSALGCDSILVLDLKLRQHYELTSTMEICQGEEYLFGDRILTETGIYKDTLHSEYGCDSIVELHLFVYPIYEDTIYRRICYGDTYSDENFNVSTQGTYQVSYRTANNCDSTITLILETVYYNDTIFETTCQGLDYDFYGTNLTQTGTYTHTLTSVEGCDSIITLNLIVNNPYKDSVYAVICEGETYTNYGFNEMEQGRYERLFTTVGGCDSIKVLNLRVNNSYNDTIIARICSGEIYNDFGFSVDAPGFHTRQYHTIYGCDSIVTLNLSVTDKITDTIKAVICEGETYAENNFNASQTGEYVRELQTMYGCDSIIVLSLNVAPVYQDTIYKIIKDGEVYDKNGFFETEQGIYAQYLSTEYGCDSIVVLSLEVDRDAKVFIPNAFTPTDRFNRLFTIYSENETVVIDEVKILNRYGGIVFETTKPDEFWDGKYKGEYVQQGTYIYMVTYHSIHTPDKQHVLRGSVMVIY